MKKYLLLIVLAAELSASNIYKNSSNMDECDIYLSGNVILKNVQMIEANDSIIYVYKSGIMKEFEINRINKIVFKHSGFWGGAAAGVGGSIGAWTLYGVILGGTEGAYYGVILGLYMALPAGLIVGMIAEFLAQDEIYILKDATGKSKTKKIKMIIKKHL